MPSLLIALLVVDLVMSPLLLKAIHNELTVLELIQTFGVRRHEQVPEYHLLESIQFDQNAAGLIRRMRFRAWNSSFLIEMRPNHRLISPHMVSVIREANQTLTRHGLPGRLRPICHYVGHVVSHGGVRAAISDCQQRLMGIIVQDDHYLVLQTIPERLAKRKRRRKRRHSGPTAEEGIHLVYKRSPALINPLEQFESATGNKDQGEADDAQQLFCDVSATDDNSTVVSVSTASELANYTIPSVADLNSLFIFPQLDPITLEIGLFLDSMLFEHFQREFTAEPEQHLTDFALALINN